jgi:hypothetical protein
MLGRLRSFLAYKRQGIALRRDRYLRHVLVLRFSASTAGLGDQIWHTHLPRVAKASGAYRKVLFSLDSVYRHPGMFEVLWRDNPHIDAFVPSASGFSFVDIRTFPPEMNKLDQIMLAAHIDDGHRWHEPEIYRRFDPIAALQGKVLYDPNFVTEAGRVTSDAVQRYLRQSGVRVDFQFAPRWNALPLPDVQVLPPHDLDWFCRAIVSSAALYCFTTGTASLAPALKKTAHVLYGAGVSPDVHHSRLNEYVLIVP